MATQYKIEKHEFYFSDKEKVRYELFRWQKDSLFERGYWRLIGEFDTIDAAKRTMRVLVKDAITSVEYYNQDGFQEYDW